MKSLHVVVLLAVVSGCCFTASLKGFHGAVGIDPLGEGDFSAGGGCVQEDSTILSPGSSSLAYESLVTPSSAVTSKESPHRSSRIGDRSFVGTETVKVRIKAISNEEGGGDSNNCGAALLQGLRISQEDRILCMSDISLPSYGGMPETNVSLFAVFDGHGGNAASEMASQNLHRRFVHHLCTTFIPSLTAMSPPDQFPQIRSPGRVSISTHDRSSEVNNIEEEDHGIHKQEVEFISQHSPPDINDMRTAVETFEHSELGNVLKEALARAISDIEATFSTEAIQMGLQAGTTACVVLQAGNHFLVASLGDTKAILCPTAACSPAPDSTTSELLGNGGRETLRRRAKRMRERESVVDVCGNQLSVVELTRDHRPDREDEKLRVEAAGGFVESYGGLPRVNGQLAVSRSIGDLAFKKYGVTADPEWTGWLKIGNNESHLVIASDGVFEKLTTREVCGVVSAVLSGIDVSVALGLTSQIREPPIALPPKKQQMKQSSRALMAIPVSYVPSAPSESEATESKEKNLAPEETDKVLQDLLNHKVTSLSGPETNSGPLKQQSRSPSNFLIQTSLPGNAGPGCAVAPLRPEIPARVLAKAVVDAAFLSGSKDNLAAIVVPFHHGARGASDNFFQETVMKRSSAHSMLESPSSLDITGTLKNGQPTEHQVVNSGMLVKGSEDGDCYELIDTVLGSSILPWLPVVEYDSTEEFMDAVKPSVERLPPIAAHAGVAKSKLEVYRKHLICTPSFALEGGDKEVCLPPEGLSRFLSLIGSIPLDNQQLLPKHWDTGGRPQDSHIVPPYSVNHHRYMLQKNFARGAFGEIWLATKRPCLKEDGGTNIFYNPQNSSHGETSPKYQEPGSIPGGKCSMEQSCSKGWAAEGQLNYGDTFILKRILVEKGGSTYLSGLREKHFGEIFLNQSLLAMPNRFHHDKIFPMPSSCTTIRSSYGKAYCTSMKALGLHSVGNVSNSMEDADDGSAHIARFVESFEVPGKELWLVFQYEGKSLSSLLYTAEVTAEDDRDLKGFKVVQPSPWWRWLKMTNEGQAEMRSIMYQLLLAVKACHDRNITHRDIKPENMVVSTDRNHVSDWPSNLTVHIIDFGSAIDQSTLEHLYGSSGPSQAEQTTEYAPPEVTLSKHWLHFHTDQAHVYDMWSVGIVMLELVLGTPHVFQISARTRVLLDRQLEGMDDLAKKTIYMLRAYLEMCILLPGIPPQHHHHHRSKTVEHSEEARLATWKCTEESIMQQIRQRDPLGMGMPDIWALRLLRQLLQWYPEDRISAAESLQHPYFHTSLQG